VPSATAQLEAALARIDALDGDIAAWVEVDREGALRAAKEAPEGPLAGMPVGVKDIIDVAGLPTRLGASAFAPATPERDATCVARLRAAGAIILGKTHTTEFAYLDPAPTRNPWNREHTPGGSSSGSAAAVAAGMVPLALGSQTVGSVLRPAAYCGIVGLKATYGLVSYAGVAALAPSFDHVGVLCRSVSDAGLALSVLAGYDAADPFSLDAPLDDYVRAAGAASLPPHIGVVRRYHEAVAGEEVSRHLHDVAGRLSAAGAVITDFDMPAGAEACRAAGEPVLRFEAAAVHRDRFAAHGERYRPGIRGLVEAGLATSEADYTAALASVRALRSSLVDRLTGVDAILLPVAPTTAPRGIETTGQGIFCAPASFSGLPAVSLPSGLGQGGLPLAVQLIAAPLAEARLLSVAAWLERVLDFSGRPPLPA
jgi:amidase